MTCGGCENAVKRGWPGSKASANVAASHAGATVAVTFDPARVTPSRFRARIAAMGYTVVS